MGTNVLPKAIDNDYQFQSLLHSIRNTEMTQLSKDLYGNETIELGKNVEEYFVSCITCAR
ncbi:hypothetical protein [Lysinibacillus xylanilyticus]|uniref:hypothetical protein n=1 Tax=Lysinibacillus xylanilyticus TaxID=582475 RepID=UPI003D03FAE7